MKKQIYFIVLTLFISCSKNENGNNSISFSLSKTSTLAFDDVFIEFDSSNQYDFFIDDPENFQYEFSAYDQSNLNSYLTKPGTYRITQLGNNSNYVEIEVYPNHIFWSDFQGDIIEITIEDSTFQQELNGAVNCVTQTAPSCSEYKEYSCANFGIAVEPGSLFREYYATDGTYSWSGYVGSSKGQCYQILLSISNAD